MMRTEAGDVSKWQGKINFEILASKIKAVYIRGGFGGYSSPANCKDPRYDEYTAGAKAVDLPFGAYWFGNYNTFPERQAQWFAECMNGNWGQLPPMLDFEWFWKPYPTPLKCLSWIKTFLTTLDKLSGKKAIIYCNPGMLRYLKPYPDWLLQRSLSIAHYTTAAEPTLYGFPSWLFWQWTDRADGIAHGVQSKQIDLQWINMTYEDFLVWIGKAPGGNKPGAGTAEAMYARIEQRYAEVLAEVLRVKAELKAEVAAMSEGD